MYQFYTKNEFSGDLYLLSDPSWNKWVPDRQNVLLNNYSRGRYVFFTFHDFLST